MRRNKDIQKNVRQLIEEYPHIVTNSNLLVVTYWLRFDNNSLTYWDDIAKCTPAESITRAFRHVKKKDSLNLNAAVENARLLQQQQFKVDYSPHLH